MRLKIIHTNDVHSNFDGFARLCHDLYRLEKIKGVILIYGNKQEFIRSTFENRWIDFGEDC